MAIGSTTAGVNMVNVAFSDAGGLGLQWQSTGQMIPRGVTGDPLVQMDRLVAALPLVNNFRLVFNEYAFDTNGNLNAAYANFITAAAAKGYKLTFVYGSGDTQNIGLNGWVKNAGTDPIPGQNEQGKFWAAQTNAQAYAALQAQFLETKGAWQSLNAWLTAHPAAKAQVYGYDLMNEPAGYRHSIEKNGTGGGYDKASFVKLYADHAVELADLFTAQPNAKVLVEGWGYGADFATLNTTMVNGVSALAYLRSEIGSQLVWSAHYYPGWLGTNTATDPVDLSARLDLLFAPLTGDDVLVTETNAPGTVDTPAEDEDITDFVLANYEWFADNGIGIGWFPFNSTGGSAFVYFDAARLQIRHQNSLAHAMNAYSLDEFSPAHAGNEAITASTATVSLRNQDYQVNAAVNPEPRFDTNAMIGWGFGYDGNDTVTGTDGSNDFLYGGRGNDSLLGLGADDFLFGQDGNDTLRGTGNDHLFGGRGNDYLASGGARDVMKGGAGNDVYLVDSADDAVREHGNSGTDRINTSLTNYSLATLLQVEELFYAGAPAFTGIGNTRANQISGGSGNDSLIGADGADSLLGNAGNDNLSGGTGDDVLQGGAGADTLMGSSGSDWASYSASTVALNVDLAGLSVAKGDAIGDIFDQIENIIGGSGNDTLRGDNAANILQGGAGDDRFWARGGADSMTGGAGADVFNFERGYGADRIMDFQDNSDKITLSKMGFTTTAQVMALASQAGANVVFAFGNGDTLTVQGITVAALSNDLLLA